MGEPLTQTRVTVRMRKRSSLALYYPPTTAAATNKLFQAAQFELPEPGRWRLNVEIQRAHGRAEIGDEVEAAELVPKWHEVWPWFAWPALLVVAFGIHQFRSRPRRGRRGLGN
jgi:hypothetical protein